MQVEEAAGIAGNETAGLEATKQVKAFDEVSENGSGELFDDLDTQPSAPKKDAPPKSKPSYLLKDDIRINVNEEDQALLDEDFPNDEDDEEGEEGTYYYGKTPSKDTMESSTQQPIVVCIRDEHDVEKELHNNPWSLPYMARDSSPEAAAARSGREFLKVQVYINGRYRPAVLKAKQSNEDYANLTMRIEGGERDKSLTLRFVGHHQQRDLVRHASVVFQLGSDDEIGCQSAIVTAVVNTDNIGPDHDDWDNGWVEPNNSVGKSKYYANLRIIYRRVIVTGVGNTDGFGEDVRETLATLGAIESPGPGRSAKLDLKVHCWDVEKKVFLPNIVRVLQLPKAADPDWAAYRINGLRDFPYTRKLMRTRQEVWEHEKVLVRVAQRHYWPSAEVGVSKQMYGLVNEVLHEEARLEGFKAAIHSVGFQYAGAPGHGYAFIRADVKTMRPSTVQDNVHMPRNNESLTLRFNHNEKVRKLSGVMVPNFKQSVDATFVLHIDIVPRDFGDYAAMPDEIPSFRDCSLFVQKGRDLASIGNALKSFYTNSVYKDFQKVFMGQRLDRIEPLDPTAGIASLSQEKKDALLAEALSLFTLNEQQTAVLMKAFSLPGGVMNVQGPAGVGKTLLLTLLAWLYTKCGMSVVLLSKTHPATNNLYNRVASLFKKTGLPAPARMFQPGNEERWLVKLADDVPRDETVKETISAMLEIDHVGETTALQQDTEGRQTRRFAHPPSSFAQRAIDSFSLRDPTKAPALSIPELAAKPTKTYIPIFKEDDSWKNIIKEQAATPSPDSYDKPVARFCALQKRHILPLGDPKVLTTEERKELFHLVNQLLKEVGKEVDCVATTIGNAHQKMLRQSIGSKTNGNCIVIVDEASMVLEADLIRAIVSLCPVERIHEEFSGESFIKGIILGGDVVQDGDLLFNEKNNEFHDDIRMAPFNRLRSAGHKVEYLDTQYRTHEFICNKMTNPTYYGGNLINGPGTAASDPGRKFNDQQVLFLTEFFKVDPPLLGVDGTSRDEASIRDHQEQKLHLRMLSVVNASDQVTPSGSKVNEMYLDFYVKLILEMFIKSTLFDPTNWVYLTPYAAQLKRVKEKVVALVQDAGLPISCVPSMAIANAAHGLEYKHVIYDIVTSEKPGFLQDDRKIVTHTTRGMNALWIIASESVLSADEESQMKRAAEARDKRGNVHDKRPYLIRVLTMLSESKLKSHFHIPESRAPGHLVCCSITQSIKIKILTSLSSSSRASRSRLRITMLTPRTTMLMGRKMKETGLMLVKMTVYPRRSHECSYRSHGHS